MLNGEKMGVILNITNLNSYIGRYRKENKSVEKRIGWSSYGLIIEKIPVLALRNRNYNSDKFWPLSWESNRNLPIAIELACKSLKAWQAFRPYDSEKVIMKIKRYLPKIVLDLQRQFVKYDTYCADDFRGRQEGRVLEIISKEIYKLSNLKNSDSPMLGSKLLHHFFPEIIPVYDTMWIGSKTLKGRNIGQDYKKYLSLMIEEIRSTKKNEIRDMEKTFIKHTEIPKPVVKWHFKNLTPILFEVCLLGTITV